MAPIPRHRRFSADIEIFVVIFQVVTSNRRYFYQVSLPYPLLVLLLLLDNIIFC